MATKQTNLDFGSLAPSHGHARGPSYERRRPEATILHKVIRENLLSFIELAEADPSSASLPDYIKKEFHEFLDCGLLQKGLLRVRCEDCHHERLLAFSCKKRGFCPSCLGRKQALTTEFLMEELLPHVPIRQYVLSFPFPVRFLLAARPAVLSGVLSIVNRAISALVKNKARITHPNLGEQELHTGAVSFIQRWGSSLNLNCHYHILIPEGVWTLGQEAKAKATFHPIDAPTNEEISKLCAQIAIRVMRYLKRKEFLGEEHIEDSEEPTPLSNIQSASIKSLIALGERMGLMVRKLGAVPNVDFSMELKGPRCASLHGFSLHAGTFCQAIERHKLRKLISYVSRPPLAHARIKQRDIGDINYKLKNPFHDGTTHVIFTPMEFVEKLAALIPKPRAHLTRYAGVFSRHSNLRAFVVPHELRAAQLLLPFGDGEDEQSPQAKTPNSARLGWAKLLKRVFDVDFTRCQLCQSENVKVIAAIMKRQAIDKILSHLGLPTEAPKLHPARPPPQSHFDC